MKRKTRSFIALLLTVFMTVGLLAGCSSGDTSEGASSANTEAGSAPSAESAASSGNQDGMAESVVVGVNVDPGGFYPYNAMNPGSAMVQQGIFEQLASTDEIGGELVMVLAESYDLDGTVLTVKVREGITDSEGNPFTANDVKFCYELAKEKGALESWTYIDSIEVTGDYTVVFNLTEDNIIAPYKTLRATMFTQAAWEASGDDEFTLHPVATGPYKLTDYVSGSSYTVEYRDDYWGDGVITTKTLNAHTVKQITYKVISDVSQMAIALETGEIDAAQSLSASDYPIFMNMDTMEALDGYTVASVPAVYNYFVQFNCSEYSAADNKLIRQAVAYCIDNEEILNIVLEGRGEASITAGIASFMKGCDTDKLAEEAKTNVYSVNVEKAKELLAEAGYEDGITLVCMTNTDEFCIKAAQIVQAQCAQAGITVKIQSYDSSLFDTYRTDPSTGWDFQFSTWGDSTGYIASLWNLIFDPTAYGELGNRSFVTAEEDPEMAELLSKCLQFGYTTEDCMAFHEHVCADEVYMYATCSPVTYIITSDKIAEIVIGQGGNLAPNGLIFAQ